MYVDEYTLDGLLDPVYSLMTGSGIIHTVTQAEEGNPQSVANKYYSNVNYYELILAFNSLGHPSEFVAGLNVEIPKIIASSTATTTVSI